MNENVRARDLMHGNLTEVQVEQPLRDAMAELIALHDRPDRAKVLVVVDAEHHYVSVLSARLLARSLLSHWTPEETHSDEQMEAAVLAAVRQRLDEPIGAVLLPDLPHVTPDSRLLDVIEQSCARKLEYLPVVENGRAVGVVPVTAIFDATAALVLRPEDEGIRFDQIDE
ncbi:MAG: CBS domain-containing protein [Planctomycetes bacterium]|nr:CBS domain-containing protein [Planctomycetota bacterium]